MGPPKSDKFLKWSGGCKGPSDLCNSLSGPPLSSSSGLAQGLEAVTEGCFRNHKGLYAAAVWLETN